MRKINKPYKECSKCTTIGDCPHPDVDLSGLGTPMPPEVCPKPIDVMNATYKKKKHARDFN